MDKGLHKWIAKKQFLMKVEHSVGETHNMIKEVQDSIENDLIEEELGQR